MGEFSTMSALKSILKGIPLFGLRGVKISEHLKYLRNLNVDIKGDAEIDLIIISCDGDHLNVIFGECKVKQKH